MYSNIVAFRYSIAEARAHLPGIIDQAKSGIPVELTRRGEPVAVLISTQEFEALRGKRPQFSDAYRQFAATRKLAEAGVSPKFARSLRDRTPGRDVGL